MFSQYQVVEIKVSIYPILSKVLIISKKKHLIPNTVLKNIFINQVGLPKNFQQIHKSLEKILHLYISFGFKWVSIEIDHFNKNKNHLIIKIHEGEIQNIDTIYIPCETNNVSALRTQFILYILQMHKGEILNLHNLENRIIYLKNMKIVENIFYDVILLPNKKTHVILSIYRFPEQNFYLLYQNYGLKIFFHNLYYLSNIIKINQLLSNLYNFHLKSCLMFFSTTNSLEQFKFLYNDWQLFYFKYCGFQYYSRNANSYHSILIDVKYSEISSIIKIAYKYPWYHIKSKSTVYSYFNIIKSIAYKYSPISRELLMQKLPFLDFLLYKLLIYIYPSNNTYFTITLQLKTIIWKNFSYLYYPIIKYLKSYYNLYLFSINHNNILYSNLTNITQQKFTIFSINFIANELDNMNTPMHGSYSQFLYINYYTFNNHFKHIYQHFKHQIYNLFFYQDLIHLKCKRYKNIYRFILHFYASINNGSTQLLPVNHRLFLLNILTLRSYFNKPNIVYPYSWNIEIEYIIPTPYFLNFYTFMQYKTILNIKREMVIANYKYFYISQMFKEYIYHGIFLGVGIKITIPFKQIPYIYLEYILKGPNRYKLYLRM
uniref:Uncharacterized protein n=1 Tax=Bulboplastis apyrenoidosa TaxID=1070855 RepID=A0A1Y9TM43_9RHOD|nr:hypothetical protein [Bulboplastis apyrenoidosa]ARO90705.1 hypothetical protein [Bulboplastis apyrenoidosa]